MTLDSTGTNWTVSFSPGVSSPRVTLDKKEAIQGGVVIVNCSVPEERAPIHFRVEKFEKNTKTLKLKKEKTSLEQNFVTVEFPIGEQDHILYFTCEARISLGFQIETSKTSESDDVTVRGQSPAFLLIILCGFWMGKKNWKGTRWLTLGHKVSS